MKKFIAVASLALSFNALASSDVVLKLQRIVTWGDSGSVSSIEAARAGLTVVSTGKTSQKHCFKEVRPNYPYAPQTVPFFVQKNFPVKVSGTTLALSGVLESSQKYTQELKKYLKAGCSVSSTLTVMIEGKNSKKEDFRSTVEINFEGSKALVRTGAVEIPLKLGTEQTVDVGYTALFGQNWDVPFKNLDPRNTVEDRNF